MLLHTFDQIRPTSGLCLDRVYENSEALIFHLNNADLGSTSRSPSWMTLPSSFTVPYPMKLSQPESTGTPTALPQCARLYSGPHSLKVRPA